MLLELKGVICFLKVLNIEKVLRQKENGNYVLKFDSEDIKNKILYILFLVWVFIEVYFEKRILEEIVF